MQKVMHKFYEKWVILWHNSKQSLKICLVLRNTTEKLDEWGYECAQERAFMRYFVHNKEAIQYLW